MPTFRGFTSFADGVPGATDRLLFETSGNLPRGVAPASLPLAVAGGANGLLSGTDKTIIDGVTAALAAKHAAVLADDIETASFTFALTHAQKMTRCDHATAAITATVPANSVVSFALGTVLNVVQWGAAAVTIAAAGGVTINKSASKTLVIAARYGVVSLWKQTTDTWLLFGDLTAA